MKNPDKKAIEVFVIIMGVLLFTAIMLVTKGLWQLLEIVEYGRITPSIADTVIGLLFNWSVWYVIWHQKWFWRFITAIFGALLKFVEFFY